jgi:alpha-tubulin suppressor-like RCC1 family protein
MSATSAAPSAPAAAAVDALVEALQLLDLSADALGHVLFRLPDAEDIARAAPACKAFSAAAQHATKLRADALPFPLKRAKDEPALRALRWAEAALRPVHTIAASNFHSHVIGHAGTLYTWGGDGEGGEEEGTIGPIGVGERREPTLLPEEIVDPPDFRGLRSIVTAVNHALCVDHDGNVWSWGSQLVKNGQLGHPDLKPRWRPAKILEAAGEELPRILQAAGGDDFSLLLTATGEVRSFGINWQGQLGLGHSGKGNSCPHPLHSPPIAGFDGRRVVEVSAGSLHSTAVDEAGGLWTWGHGEGGRLGLGLGCFSRHQGHNVVRNRPCRVMLLSRERIVHANAGGEHTLAVTENGQLYAWGVNKHGQLGVGDFTNKALPTLVTSFEQISETQVAGALFGAGHPDKMVYSVVPSPTPRVKQVSAGSGEHSIVLTEAGEVYTMGDGTKGQLGQGEFEPDAPPPREYEGLADFAMGAGRPRLSRPRKVEARVFSNLDYGHTLEAKAIEVEAAYGHTLVKFDDGSIFSCGAGDDGATGHGDVLNHPLLTQVEGVPMPRASAQTRAA